jgi:hypothetical protein
VGRVYSESNGMSQVREAAPEGVWAGYERPLQRECGPGKRPLYKECGPRGERPLQRECGPGERPLYRECGPSEERPRGFVCFGSPRPKECDEPKRVLQQRLLGHVMRFVYEAQDFMAACCKADAKGIISEEKKRCVVSVTKALAPWVRVLAGITTHKQLERLHRVWRVSWKRGGIDTSHGVTVYARVNLRSNDMYIGETGAFDKRVKQHYMATYKHSDACSRPCLRCPEHTKYLKHRAAPAHAWLMVPLWVCDTKYEAQRLERWANRQWRPSLNAGDKPFWLLKQAYAEEARSARVQEHRREYAPWRRRGTRDTQEIESLGDAGAGRSEILTTYTVDTLVVLDLGCLLKRGAEVGEAYNIKVQPGTSDMTNWKRLKERFGNSYIRVQIGNETPLQTTLQQWDGAKAIQWGAQFLLYIRPEIQLDREEILKGLVEAEEFTEQLENCTDEELAFYWRCRTNLDKQSRIKVRQMVWQECERRYDGFTCKPIVLRIPYFRELDASKVKRSIAGLLGEKGWPPFLIEWHIKNLKLHTESQPCIEEILGNVNKPWFEHRGCKCAQVKEALKKLGYDGELPHTEGHIFFTGREYIGPCRKALNVAACNVPTQTRWDLTRAWERIRTQLPGELCGKKRWVSMLEECVRPCWRAQDTSGCPSTRDVYSLRKALAGLVIGPLDKNNGELWLCCPELYSKALACAYGPDKGYEKVYPRKLTAYRRQRYKDDLAANILQAKAAPEREAGTEQDVVRAWEVIYKRRGWNKIASYNRKGGFNKPYVLFKAKNVAPSVRAAKLMKTRPIAPGTKHPMRRLLGLVGRAWSFVTSQMSGEHMVINKCHEVPEFLQGAAKALAPFGELGLIVRDIESCYPSMPKDAIRFGLLDITQRLRREHGFEGVTVPKFSRKKPCSWKRMQRGGIWLSFEVMLAVMEFTLDNAIVAMGDGDLRRQAHGIPMGLELAPGMTIGACGWMEHEWAQSIGALDKLCFRGKRYMDDIAIVYAKPSWWDHERFVRDFERSECYMEPLRLEPGKEGTFLETCFEVRGQTIRHWLKNENEPWEEPKVWRYQHFHSHSPFKQKRATMLACLRKAQHMASDQRALWDSAYAKLAEFQRMGYPRGMLWDACSRMGATTRDPTWFKIRALL